jgi:23S rRNA (guanine2445-N2)-methyltransferase / 23S rRNA (guanine2069-N7)-methyltransferase
MPATWKKLIEEANDRRMQGAAHIPKIIGHDASRQSIRLAQKIIDTAQLTPFIHVECQELAQCKSLSAKPGLVITNPPYGERLGEKESLTFTYQHLGSLFKQHFSNWRCSVFTGNPDLAKALKLGPESIYRFFNGPIPCQLLNFIIRPSPATQNKINMAPPTPHVARDPETAGLDFVNRLEKNIRKLQPVAEKNNITCYRLYDADLPDYSVAIDCYQNFIHIQEYAAPKTIDPEKAAKRLDLVLHHVQTLLNVPASHIFLKTRSKQKGLNQYQKQASSGHFHTVTETCAKFLVNFTDYLDTGLFLDSRPIRQWIFDHAKGKSFLNLFCYTGSATVYAALAKAANTTSVDLSATYLEWAKRNLALNGFAPDTHQFIQADCLQWLQTQPKKYELILLDPPTFSNSKRMLETLDIQRDQGMLIRLAMKHLTRDGTLIFVTNKHRFTLDDDLKKEFQITDFSKKSLPFDFQRYPIHQAYLLQHNAHRSSNAGQ